MPGHLGPARLFVSLEITPVLVVQLGRRNLLVNRLREVALPTTRPCTASRYSASCHGSGFHFASPSARIAAVRSSPFLSPRLQYTTFTYPGKSTALPVLAEHYLLPHQAVLKSPRAAQYAHHQLSERARAANATALRACPNYQPVPEYRYPAFWPLWPSHRDHG